MQTYSYNICHFHIISVYCFTNYWFVLATYQCRFCKRFAITNKLTTKLFDGSFNLTNIRNVSMCQGLHCRCYCLHNHPAAQVWSIHDNRVKKIFLVQLWIGKISGFCLDVVKVFTTLENVTQLRLVAVIPYQHFGTSHQSLLQGSTSPVMIRPIS